MLRRICIPILAAALSLCLLPCSAIAESYWDDPHPPVLSSIAVDRSVASVGDTVRISWDVQDADGVESTCVYVVDWDPSLVEPGGSVSGPRGFVSAGNEAGGFDYRVSSSDAPGRRWVVGLKVCDKASFVTTFWDPTYAAAMDEQGPTFDMSAAVFEIEENDGDPHPPVLSSIAVDRSVASVGDTVRISWDVQDADGVESTCVYVVDWDPSLVEPGGSVSGPRGFVSAGNEAGGFDYRVSSSDAPGRRWVVGLKVCDKASFVTTFWDPTYAAAMDEQGPTFDMSAAVFEIVDPASIPTYSVLEGNSSVYMPGSNAGLTFRFDGPLEKFMHLEIDGAVIPSLYYALREGSTIVTLNPAYLDQMKAGAHTIVAHYTDGGRAVGIFGIQPKAAEKGDGTSSGAEEKTPPQPTDRSTGGLPQTGDTTPLLLLFGICFVALAMMATSFFGMKEARQSR